MCINQRPRSREARVFAALQKPHPGHNEEVVRERMAELMPPILSDDLTLVDLVDTPEMAIAFLIQVNSLENMVVEWNFRGKLRLVVSAIEAHFEFLVILGVFFDVVHGLVGFLCHFEADGLVDAGEVGDSLGGVVEIFVVGRHVGAVGVSDGDVVGEFGAA